MWFNGMGWLKAGEYIINARKEIQKAKCEMEKAVESYIRDQIIGETKDSYLQKLENALILMRSLEKAL